jgi:hypothetical protein
MADLLTPDEIADLASDELNRSTTEEQKQTVHLGAIAASVLWIASHYGGS